MDEDTVIMLVGFICGILTALVFLICFTQCCRGDEKDKCYGNGTCDTGLVCKSNLCVKP